MGRAARESSRGDSAMKKSHAVEPPLLHATASARSRAWSVSRYASIFPVSFSAYGCAPGKRFAALRSSAAWYSSRVKFQAAGTAALRQQRSTVSASEAGNRCVSAVRSADADVRPGIVTGAVTTRGWTEAALGAASGWAGLGFMVLMISEGRREVVSTGTGIPLYYGRTVLTCIAAERWPRG